jgi:peptidyl-prolyl cis-trans isomerase C
MNAVIILGVSRSKSNPVKNYPLMKQAALAWLGAAAVILLLSACGRGLALPALQPSPMAPLATQTPALHTATPFQPSPTSEPLAALVNGEPISLVQFQAELARYQAAAGTELATQDQQRVLQAMIDQLLLAQAAAEAGYVLDEAALQTRLEQLSAEAGGQQALLDWMASNGYVLETFRQDLAQAVAAAWLRDQIAASVPVTAEQVHARWLRFNNREEAQQTLAQIRAGADFAALAAEADPLVKGDLDWFPRGYLVDATLEEAAFLLQPGQVSEVIECSLGFILLQVIERDPARPLSPDALLQLQSRAVQDWLEQRRADSSIQVYLP